MLLCLKKNQNAPRPPEYPPVREEKMSKRLCWIKGCKYKTSSGLGYGMFFHFRRLEGFIVFVLLFVPVLLGSGRRGMVPCTGWPCRHTVR